MLMETQRRRDHLKNPKLRTMTHLLQLVCRQRLLQTVTFLHHRRCVGTQHHQQHQQQFVNTSHRAQRPMCERREAGEVITAPGPCRPRPLALLASPPLPQSPLRVGPSRPLQASPPCPSGLTPTGPSRPHWPHSAPVGPHWPQSAPVGPCRLHPLALLASPPRPWSAHAGPSPPQSAPTGPSRPQLAPAGFTPLHIWPHPPCPWSAQAGPIRPQSAPTGPSPPAASRPVCPNCVCKHCCWLGSCYSVYFSVSQLDSDQI